MTRSRNKALQHAIVDYGGTQTELAAAAGTSVHTLSGVINGRITPSTDLRARLAEVLNVNEHDLFEQVPA